MGNNYTPILVVPAVPHEGGIRFLHQNYQIDIEPDMADQLWQILSYTNGYNSIPEIAHLAELPVDEVSDIMSDLAEEGLVVDSKAQYAHFHLVSNLPSSFNSELTLDEIEAYTKSERLPVKPGKILKFDVDKDTALYHDIRKGRRSCRSFSGQRLSLNQIGSICHYAYFIPEHSAPSGGALYPLKIFVLMEGMRDGIPSGYYEYDAENDNLVLFNEEIDSEQLKYCFNQEEMPFGSSTQIVIAADLGRQPYKYANRGYRLTLLEAGHVAENINFYCAERGFGACELGGVLDGPLAQELDLPNGVWPLLTIAVGFPAYSREELFDEAQYKMRFVETAVGDDQPVKAFWAETFGPNGSFFGATATYLDGMGDAQYTGATSTSYPDAVFKATIEGYERWQSGQVRVDFYGSAKELTKNWLDPRHIIPLTPEQAQRCGVKPFTEDLAINWTLGTDADGLDIYVPSDLVYYGQKDSKNRIYYGNSSGAAAHFDFNEAKKRATIELIERDALMTNWFAQKSPITVMEQALPVHARKRIKHWAEQGRQMTILQIPSSFGLVFETVIFSDEYPCFVSGASATIDNKFINKAILKSIQEAEYSLLLALRYPDETPIDPTTVSTPVEHGKVYHFKENADKLHWLLAGKTSLNDGIRITNLDAFYKQLRLVTVDLTDEDSTLKVVRVFSPYLVPINFGFDSAHYTHSAIVHPDSLKMPHYFA